MQFGILILWINMAFVGVLGEDKRLLVNNDPYVIADLQTEIQKLKADIEALTITAGGSVGPGMTYVRWGKNSCPSNATVVYSGYVAGKGRGDKGSGTNVLCLHNTPRWGKYMDGNQGARATIYGAEYEPDYGTGSNWVHNLIPDIDDDQDTPCTVCRALSHKYILIIPGSNICEVGWTLEYDGYLMSTRLEDEGATEFICVDRTADYIPGGKNSNQFLLYPTEAKCGTLPCPPFVEGREMTCAVCSS